MNKIILRGYYGFGNLGDDILMITSLYIIKKNIASHKLYICSESKQSDYISNLVKNAKLINSASNVKADLIVQGGGGIYFDFYNGPIGFKYLNVFIRFIGYRKYLWLYNIYRVLTFNPGIRAKRRIGIGIGLGTFTKSSSKFYTSILTLADYNLLYVRDSESYKHLEEYNFSYDCYKSTDIAFYKRAWLKLKEIPKNKGNNVGIILRDWSYDNHLHLKNMFEVVKGLEKCGIKASFYSFDHNADKYYISSVEKQFGMSVWRPEENNLNEFLAGLATNSLVISSRAHGAIVSACLGIPGICIEVEPKLRVVQQMLPQSYRLVAANENKNTIISLVQKMLSEIDELSQLVKEEVEINESIISNDIKHLKETIKNYE